MPGLSIGLGLNSVVMLRGWAPSPTTSESSVTHLGATFPFDANYPVGYYADEVPFAVGATVLPTSPATVQYDGTYAGGETYTGRWVHGLMVNPGSKGADGVPGAMGTGTLPSLTPQGYDSLTKAPSVTSTPTEFAYDAALNEDPALTGNIVTGTGKTLMKAVSNLTDPPTDTRDRLIARAVLDLLPTVPPTGSFRRWQGSTDKTPQFYISDLDLTVIPSLAQPGGSTLPNPDTLLTQLGPLMLHASQMLFARGIAGANNQEPYGGYLAEDICEAMLYVLTTGVDAAKRLKLIYKMVAAGVELADAAEQGRRWSSGSYSFGGAHQWCKILVVFAARLLRNSPNAALLEKWADAAQNEIWADDMMMVQITRERIEGTPYEPITTRPQARGYLDCHENTIDWLSKPSTQNSNSFALPAAYRGNNSYRILTNLMVARLIGAGGFYSAKAHDYLDRFYSWWAFRGLGTNDWEGSNFSAYMRAMTAAYFKTATNGMTSEFTSASAPSLARSTARSSVVSFTASSTTASHTYVWFEANKNLDYGFVPAAAAFAVSVAGTPVTLADVTNTGCAGTASSGSTNMSQPEISMTSTAGLYPGMRVSSNTVLPHDTIIMEVVSGTVIRISNTVPATFSGQSITFSPISVYGRSLIVALPSAITAGQAVVASYTQPGTNQARDLAGNLLPSIASGAVTNRTDELPPAATTRQTVYTGATAATRQYSGSPQPSSALIKRLRMSLRFWLASKTANDTIMANSNGSTTAWRLYFPTAADLRLTHNGVSFRMPGAGTALPLNKLITLHLILDWTATSYATMYRAEFKWDTGSHVASVTGSTGVLDGTSNPDISALFSAGMFLGAIGTGGSPMNGGWSELTIGWGDANFALPVDFTGPQFAWNADWGGNGQNVWGQNHRYYAGTVAEWNGTAINRGNGGSGAMTPRRIDAVSEELVTDYTLAAI